MYYEQPEGAPELLTRVDPASPLAVHTAAGWVIYDRQPDGSMREREGGPFAELHCVVTNPLPPASAVRP
jgi:hypothetical protein